jgi:hypothetical protein
VSYKRLPLEENKIYTKKCFLNNWDFPPANFLEKFFFNEKLKNFNFNENDTITETFSNYSPKKNDSINSTERVKFNFNSESKDSFNISYKGWNKEIYLDLIKNDTEKYNNSNTNKDLYLRGEGSWVSEEEFMKIFNAFIVLHNPKGFESSVMMDCNWYNYKEDLFEFSEDNFVIKISKNLKK